MKKYLMLALVLVVVIALSVFLFRTFGGDKISYKPEANENIITIGVFEPLTGINSEGGYQEKLGIMYANEICPTVKINGVTYDIKLAYADNQSEVKAAETAAQELADGGVSAVLGSYGSTVTLVGADIFDAAGIPAIGISCTNPEITLKHKNYFRVCFLDSFQGRAMADYAYSQDLRRAAVVTQVGDSYSKGLGEYFTQGFESLGGSTSQLTFNSATKNFSELIAQIKASDADFVYIPSSTETAVLFINQMRDAGLMTPIYGGDTWDTNSIISGTAVNGLNVYFSSQFDEDGDIDLSGAEFVSKFTTWLNTDDSRIVLNGGSDRVSPVSALAYDAYMVLVEAVKSAGSTEPKAIMKALPTISYEGETGNVAFDENGDCGKATAYIKTIDVTNQKFKTLQQSLATD